MATHPFNWPVTCPACLYCISVLSDPKILLLNIELELKSEKENAEIRLDDPAKYQSIVDAEWNIIYAKLAECANSGAQIVLSRCVCSCRG
jgi:chaperonin GroEL (HSP60 family)